jgi:hypothetical protein
MEEFDPHISIEPISKIKNPDYKARTITFENLNKRIETPFKIFPGKNLSNDVFDNFSSGINDKFVENGRYLKGYQTWERLRHLLTDASGDERNSKLTTLFRINPKLWEELPLTTLSLVFHKNPYEPLKFTYENKPPRVLEPFDDSCFTFLLSFIYARSKACVLIPDIKIEGNSIAIKKYLDHVDECVRIISQWNNKPIFVPLQLNLSADTLNEILTHYNKMKYSNIWINFLAHSCDESYIGNLRAYRQRINNKMKSLDVSLYYSHIQKEITPNIQSEKVLASDILTQFNGADFIGINKNKYDDMPIFGSDFRRTNDAKRADELNLTIDEYNEMRVLNKNRLFDPNSYYYYNLDQYPQYLPLDLHLLTNESINAIQNGILLTSEIERTREFVLEANPKNVEKEVKKELKERKTNEPRKKTLIDYIDNLQGIKDNPVIRRAITNSTVQANFFDDIVDL